MALLCLVCNPDVIIKSRFDTSRFIVEHYVDGDLVDDKHPTNRTLASPDNLHVWGKSLR